MEDYSKLPGWKEWGWGMRLSFLAFLGFNGVFLFFTLKYEADGWQFSWSNFGMGVWVGLLFVGFLHIVSETERIFGKHKE